jgi:hypothetical protein
MDDLLHLLPQLPALLPSRLFDLAIKRGMGLREKHVTSGNTSGLCVRCYLAVAEQDKSTVVGLPMQ